MNLINRSLRGVQAFNGRVMERGGGGYSNAQKHIVLLSRLNRVVFRRSFRSGLVLLDWVLSGKEHGLTSK